jgi:1-acyl-sn-glycerol-3-phosphate acyltransferase
VAGVLILIVGPPGILVSALAGRREWLYPWALFGGRSWLRLSGMRVRVRGKELLDPKRPYVFVANHRSTWTRRLCCFSGSASA